jgi:hypothetical protein
VRAVALELLGQQVTVGHGHILPFRVVMQVTDAKRPM